MGITGLIPFLEKASKRGNISQFAGGSVAIDTYCWLHKGAFSCADKIALGQPTDAHVKYCMRFVHMLRANRIKPILVFDGRHLPAKKETEVKRRENRESTRRRAAELMRMGQTAEGRNLLRRSIDITHEMALQLIKKCQEENVDCIVAPYEADAQLAYLNITGIADVVITEDSDLTLFGCKKIFFKMDLNGNGLLVEQDRLHLAMNVRADNFEIEKFRHMCILSGCDYLASLPGIGLSKACKFIIRNTNEDIHKALTRLGSCLNMKALVVTKEYRDAFLCALVTFKHQMVYCPLRRKQVRLYPPTPEVTEEQLHYAGEEISEDVAYQLALGNYDPFSMKKLHDFDPDSVQKRKGKTNSWHEKIPTEHISIWSKNYKITEAKENERKSDITKWPDTSGRVMILNTDATKRKTTPKKRNFCELAEELSANDALKLYGSPKIQKNDENTDGRTTPPPRSKSSSRSDNESTSPILSRKSNPFAKRTNDLQLSPNLICQGKRRIRLKNFVGFRQTIIDDTKVETSKYFSQNSTTNEMDEEQELNAQCAKIVISTESKIETEKFVDEMNEIKENRDTNVIEEMETMEETSSSSGIFSSEATSEQDRDINLSPEEITTEIKSIHENETKNTRTNHTDSLDSDKYLDTNYNQDNRVLDDPSNIEVQKEEDEAEYSFTQNNVESLRCNLFKWANTKVVGKTSVSNLSMKQKPIVTTKTKNMKKIQPRKKTAPLESQQSLLNMFGFQKKTVLKHY